MNALMATPFDRLEVESRGGTVITGAGIVRNIIAHAQEHSFQRAIDANIGDIVGLLEHRVSFTEIAEALTVAGRPINGNTLAVTFRRSQGRRGIGEGTSGANAPEVSSEAIVAAAAAQPSTDFIHDIFEDSDETGVLAKLQDLATLSRLTEAVFAGGDAERDRIAHLFADEAADAGMAGTVPAPIDESSIGPYWCPRRLKELVNLRDAVDVEIAKLTRPRLGDFIRFMLPKYEYKWSSGQGERTIRAYDGHCLVRMASTSRGYLELGTPYHNDKTTLEWLSGILASIESLTAFYPIIVMSDTLSDQDCADVFRSRSWRDGPFRSMIFGIAEDADDTKPGHQKHGASG